MIDFLCRSCDDASGCLCRTIASFGEALLAPPLAESPTDVLTEAERERIRQSLWLIRRSIGELGESFLDDLARLLNEGFGGPNRFVQIVKAWANLIDDLVLAAEYDYGSQHGRGYSKRRHVKGAILYLVHKAKITIPEVPQVLEPFCWNIVLDPVVNVLHSLSERYNRWGDVPQKPTFRARMSSGMHRVGGLLDTILNWLTNLGWRLVLAWSPVSPRLKKTVNAFLGAEPDPSRTVLVFASWVVNNTKNIVVLAHLFSTVVVEAQFFVRSDEARQKAYAREFLLTFIEFEVGLPPRDSLRFLLLSAGIDLAVDVVFALFEKRPPNSRRLAPAIVSPAAP